MRRIVSDALAEFLMQDMELLHVSVNERTLAHRLAIYIENQVEGWHVDCEYNRDRHFPKMRPSDRKKIIPDIIVHRRNSPRNLLIVEIKKTSHSKKEKAEASRRALDLTGEWTKMPRYCHAAVLTFPVRHTEPKQALCEWYHRDGCNAIFGGPPKKGTFSVPLSGKTK
ncbi:MAG TPA: hypothetical protein VIT91_14250 [Chthoniobacterales bacterium]